MISEPQEKTPQNLLEELGRIERKHDTLKNYQFAQLLSIGVDLLRYDQNSALQEYIEQELDIVNRYNAQEDFPSSDDEILFVVSMQVWKKTVNRMYSKDDPIRGADIVNNYVESDNPELSVRYLEEYNEKFLSKLLDQMRIEGEDLESIRQKLDDETFNQKIAYCCLLICVWHKFAGRLIPDRELSDESEYIVN